VATLIKKAKPKKYNQKTPIILSNRVEAFEVMEAFTKKAQENRAYALDTETGGLFWYKDPLFMISLYTPGMPAVVIPVAWDSSQVSLLDLAKLFRRLASNTGIVCYLFNAKFDMHFMESADVKLANQLVDVRVLAHMTNNAIPSNLKTRARLDAGMDLVEFKKLFNLTRGKTLLDYPVEDVGQYAGNDAIATYKLGNKYSNGGLIENPSFLIADDPELTVLYKKIEHKITPILYRMERRGIMANLDNINAYKQEAIPKLKAMEERAIQLAGTPVNIRSPKQLMEVLHRRGHRLDSTSAEILDRVYMETKDKFIEALLEYRGLQKLISTYVEGILAATDANGFVHTSFNQVGTVTGRLSSSDPNLQNIPRDRAIRGFFKPRPGYVFIVRDYGQLELRVVAHVAQDPTMIEEFQKGMDIHRVSAAAIFGKNPEDITDEERQKGKSTTSFGVLYGMGAWNLALQLGVSDDKAEMFIVNWFKKYRMVDRFFKRIKQSALQSGYVRSFLGRVRYLPELKSGERRKVSAGLREAGNTVVQGPAADLVKLAMIHLEVPEVWHTGARMLLQVHDELMWEVPERNAYIANKIIEERMANFPVARKLSVPLVTDGGIGRDWYGAKNGELNKEFAERYG
jgi:DNA polymerase-1